MRFSPNPCLVFYTLTLNNQLVLNPIVNPQIDIDLLVTNIGLIAAPTGFYGVITTELTIVRRSEALITVLEGSFSRLDWGYIAAQAQTLIVNLGTGESRLVLAARSRSSFSRLVFTARSRGSTG